jgi:tetratricopeptide (TPR) repeat protein
MLETMKLKLVSLAVLAALSAACSQAPVRASEEAAPPAAGLAESEPALPNVELSEDILYRYLLAEIAGQRDQAELASKLYVQLATETRDPRLARRASEVALYARRADDATRASALWAELEPQSVKARQTHAALLLSTGRLGAARDEMRALFKLQPDNVGAGFLQLHGLLAKTPDRKAVVALVEELARDYPGIAESHFAVAQAAASAGQFDAALEAVRRAAAISPTWEPAVLYQAHLLQRVSRADALAYLKDYLEHYPEAGDVRLTYARILVSANQLAVAREEFSALLVKMPKQPDVRVALGLIAMQLGEWETAQTHLMQSLELGYKDPDAVRLYLGQVAEERKQFDEAERWYLAAEEGESMINARVRHAHLLARTGRMPQALADLDALAAENPEQGVEIVQAQAQILRDAREYPRVHELLSQGLVRYPDSLELLYDRAMAAERLNRIDWMETDLRRLIGLKPDHAHAYNALGYTLAERGERLDEAVGLIQQAHKLAPDDAFILDSLGWVLFRQGNLDAARGHLERAYAKRPDPEIAAHLGEVLWALGQRDDASKLWASSLSIHPGNDVLKDVIKKFQP